jgi:hypothetical protein
MIRTADYIVERQAEYGVGNVFMSKGAAAIASTGSLIEMA